MKLSPCLLSAATVLLFTGAATAQVVVNEVAFDAGGRGSRWVELANRSSATVDISSWSLYYATATAGQPNNYWFGFPPGTTIAASSLLRVNWLAPVQPSTATEVWTGDAPANFLFGYNPEDLLPEAGALALFSTQDNALMSSPAFIVDWMQWGTTGFPRENLAVTAGRWFPGATIGPSQVGDSIALIGARQAEPTPANAFFHDASPTSLAANNSGAATASFGTNCSLPASRLAPILQPVSTPTLGNRDFLLHVTNTTAGESLVLLLGVAQSPGSFKLGGACSIWIDGAMPFEAVALPSRPGATDIPVSLLQVQGGPIELQAITVGGVTSFSTSNGLTVFVGA